MEQIVSLTYHGADVRTVEKEDGLWWVLKDVCGVIGISNHFNVATRLDDDEKALHLVEAPGGKQNTTIINEPGLYNVILRSDKPEAKEFKRWVTHDVLPKIRKTGTYSMQQMTPAELIAAQANMMVKFEKQLDDVHRQQLALEEKVDGALHAFTRPAEDHWKHDMDNMVKSLCERHGLSLLKTRGRLYDELERTTGCSIQSRLTRLRTRRRKAGMTYRDAMALTKLDAIGNDKQLRAIFESIVRSWDAKSLTANNEGGLAV